MTFYFPRYYFNIEIVPDIAESAKNLYKLALPCKIVRKFNIIYRKF